MKLSKLLLTSMLLAAVGGAQVGIAPQEAVELQERYEVAVGVELVENAVAGADHDGFGGLVRLAVRAGVGDPERFLGQGRGCTHGQHGSQQQGAAAD